jgi:heme/copper-type cytochrome/quinol oxidase subunit 2
MTRLRSYAATARQARLRQVAASARHARLRAAAATAVAVMIAGGSSVLACPVCFGAEETTMVGGTKLGVLVMLGITLVVQGGFVAFFLYLRRRAKRNADAELDTEWSALQGASRT